MGVAEKDVKRVKIEVNHVSKSFELKNNRIDVLKDIDLKIYEGEFITIVGASGCGKSTLTKLISGLDFPTSGTVKVDGTEVTGPSVKTGIIFQEARLFPWLSVEKNIEFGIHEKISKKEKNDKVQDIIDNIGLRGFEKALPKQLSGGMQQRVNIGRALINEPNILLLDEPFGALDALTRINMQNEVLKIWEKNKATMLLITHDIDEAIFLSDRVVVLSDKPGVISKEIKIPMSKPRDRSSSDFMNIRREIYAEFFENSSIDIEYYI
jgi:sulfonate transport system ATP-binding protein